MNYRTQQLIQTSAFDRACVNLSMGNNLHRGYTKHEIIPSLNNPNVYTNGIKAEVSEFNGRVQVKVYYKVGDEEYYVAAC